MSQEIINKAAEIVKENTVHGGEAKFGICTISLIDEDGFPSTSIITPAKADGLSTLAFGIQLDGNKGKRAKNCNRASICFGTMEHCINLVGEVEILTSDDIKREMWYDGLGAHFPKGVDDPNYGVLKFTTKRYKLFVDFQPEVEGTL